MESCKKKPFSQVVVLLKKDFTIYKPRSKTNRLINNPVEQEGGTEIVSDLECMTQPVQKCSGSIALPTKFLKKRHFPGYQVT